MSVAILPLSHMPLWHMQGFLPVFEILYFFPSVCFPQKKDNSHKFEIFTAVWLTVIFFNGIS